MRRTEQSWFGVGRIILSGLWLVPLAVLLGMATRSEGGVAGKYKSADSETVRSTRAPIFVAREFYDE